MALRIFLLLAALAVFGGASTACTIYTAETGAVSSDGSVYLGWSLFSGRGNAEREDYPVGQQHGAFSSFRLRASKAVALHEVTVILADGERFRAPVPGTLGAGQWSDPIALPGGAREIHSFVITAKSQSKQLAKLEIYGTR
jgi:hypothetical protein